MIDIGSILLKPQLAHEAQGFADVTHDMAGECATALPATWRLMRRNMENPQQPFTNEPLEASLGLGTCASPIRGVHAAVIIRDLDRELRELLEWEQRD